jgi:uncharacterized protein YhaN
VLHNHNSGEHAVKIDNLSVDGFGVWKGLQVDGVSEHLTLFCGQNEAGKTTMMQYIRSMMFGFSPERLNKYTPPVYGGLAGGSVDLLTPTGNYEVQRYVDPNRHSDPIGDLTVIDGNDGSVHGRAQLNALMSDVDESIFNNVFAIGLREIQELGALNSTDAAEHLYKLTSGMDRVSLIDVMKDLRRRREEIWASDPENESKLTLLSVRRTKLTREIEDLKQRSKRWSRIAAEVTDVTHQLSDIDVELEQVERESRLLEIAIQISERWQNRRLVIEQINAFGTLPHPRDLSVEELDQCNARITQQKERIDQIKDQRRKIKKEALALPINRQLYAQKSRIEAISEHSPWVESLERQVNQLQEEIDKIENGIVSEVDGLGSQLQIRAKDVKDLGNRGLRELEDSGGKLTKELQRMEKLKQELDQSEFDVKQVKTRIGSSFGDINPNESYEETSKQVSRLRRRIELEEKIDKLNRSRLGLERDIDSIVAEQVLPVNKLSIIGFAFIAGMILLGFGLLNVGGAFSDASTSGGLVLMICGLIAFFVSMGLKYHWEKIAKDELDDFRHQLEINRQQMKRSKHEREEIERQLPSSAIGQWDMDLQDAEGRLMRLQDLAPMENRIQKSKAMAEEVRRHIQTQQRTIETARGQWKASLRTAGLPDALEPHQLKEITLRSERISTFRVRLDQLTSEKNQRQKELTALNQRINTMLYETGVQFKSNSLTDRLNQINSAINDQRSMVSARKELASKYKTLRSRLQKTKRELDKALGKRQRLLTSVGADSEELYRQFDIKHKDRRKLMQKRDNLSEQIDAGLGANYKQDDISALMDAYGQSGLEKRWESVLAKIEELKANQASLQQQRGEFLQEVKTLGEDSRMDEARMELNVIDAKIAALKKEWQKLAVATQMLEMIRETYESKRQPETLKEASNYLTRLTEDHYVRIWTRLTGEELLVDNHEGETIPVDKLSRGTREAVYLSLRMALVGAYARRGAVIPMVLDDVLVNFDGRRTRAAAEVLYDFSRNGYQILMFTCHDHMRDLFHELGADVRILPDHKDVFENQAKPVRFGDGAVQHAEEDHETIVFDNAVRQPVVESSFERPLEKAARQFEPHAETFDAIPVEYVATKRNSQIALDTDNYDAELEYELSAVVNDQHSHQRLRNELVYVTPGQKLPIDLSGNDAIWREASPHVVR